MNEASTKIEGSGTVPKLNADDPAAEGMLAAMGQCMEDMKPLNRKAAGGDGKKGKKAKEESSGKQETEKAKTEAHQYRFS